MYSAPSLVLDCALAHQIFTEYQKQRNSHRLYKTNFQKSTATRFCLVSLACPCVLKNETLNISYIVTVRTTFSMG